MAHGQADILAHQPGSGAQSRRTETAQTTGVAVCGNYDTLLQGGNRGPVPRASKQALSLQTNTLWLSDAGQCADVPQPAAERVQGRLPVLRLRVCA